ncbi:site-specific integrase [Streptosporangium sp. NPDC050280]|uniref:site-specific integrase n=1 Tax=unclassified Streptosporangium TaxID=2632669 RepID=UPI0034120FBD
MSTVSTAGMACGARPGVPPPSGTGPQAARPDGGRAEGRGCGGAPRRRLDLDAGTVRVERQLMQLTGKGLVFTEPKSAAGKRTVVIPDLIIEDLRAHVKDFTQDGDKGLIFAGPDDGPLRNTNFNRRVWAQALVSAGLPKVHFHDLRHTGNTLAANAGASIRKLMERMSHSSTRAAMVYQHSTDERQRKVARKLDGLARGALAKGSGTQRARKRKKAE